MSLEPSSEEINEPLAPHFSAEEFCGEVPPWTEIEAGRFMPRRVRGSFQGRALG